MPNIIDKLKLPYQIGDFIRCDSNIYIAGIVIGYFFPRKFNCYTTNCGYAIKLIDSEALGHYLGESVYTASGNNIKSEAHVGYWWVPHYKAILIRPSLQFLLKC